MRSRKLVGLATVFAAFAVVNAAHAGYIYAKAHVAQVLIHRAWLISTEQGIPAKPWPWADTYPVGRLGFPERRVELFVLEGGSGRTLAFGPGHVSGTAEPGGHGNVAIAGHRDTHFRFLADLKMGDRLLLESRKGELIDYVVATLSVVDQSDAEVLRDHGDDRLTLVTCYPIDAVQPGGPQRYVVTALRSSPERSTADY
jgi:sortase A